MEIRFLVINGSERSNGNTEIAIDIAKSILNKISGDNKVIFDVISLKDLMIKSCNDCHEVENCNYRKEPCQQNDDIKIVLKKDERGRLFDLCDTCTWLWYAKFNAVIYRSSRSWLFTI